MHFIIIIYLTEFCNRKINLFFNILNILSELTKTFRVKKWLKIVLLIAIGIFVGSINGFLGAGGGMLLVPAYLMLTKQSPKIIHATAVFIIMPICLVSGLVYFFKGVFDLSIFLPVVVGSIGGGAMGTFLLKKFSNEILSLVFWVVMIVAGGFIIFF